MRCKGRAILREIGMRFAAITLQGPNFGPKQMPATAKKIRIAAVGDLHYGKTSPGVFQPLMTQVSQMAGIFIAGSVRGGG